MCEIKMSKPQTTETDGVVVSGHVLGKKKKQGGKADDSQATRWHDAVSTEKTLSARRDQKKEREKKTW